MAGTVDLQFQAGADSPRQRDNRQRMCTGTRREQSMELGEGKRRNQSNERAVASQYLVNIARGALGRIDNPGTRFRQAATCRDVHYFPRRQSDTQTDYWRRRAQWDVVRKSGRARRNLCR